MIAPATIEAIRDDGAGEAYPRSVLEGGESALVLFAAAFLGRQDAYWIAEAGLQADCVDLDADRLADMEPLYPADWSFIQRDAYEYARETGEMYDVVSIDEPTNHFDRVLEELPTFCDIARRAVIFGASRRARRSQLPTGWRLTDFRFRSRLLPSGIYWAVVERVA